MDKERRKKLERLRGLQGRLEFMTPEEMWDDLAGLVLAAIAKIDAVTPPQDPRPRWWTDMMAIRQELLDQGRIEKGPRT